MNVYESFFTPQDKAEILKVLGSGQLSFGPLVTEFENAFRECAGKRFNIATNSASSAAFMIFAFLREVFGVCDVYTPSIGFISPVWAAKHFGHNVIFVDVDDQLLFDQSSYRRMRHELGGENKPVLMPVLYGGVSTIEWRESLGDEYVVVDSAHTITPNTLCDVSFHSFHSSKPLAMAEGGMISTDDKALNQFALMYRNFGRKNDGSTYDIVAEGGKFYMTALNASIGLSQLSRYEANRRWRRRNFEHFRKKLPEFKILDHDPQSSYYFGTFLNDKANEILSEWGIGRHYPMIHRTKKFQVDYSLENTEAIWNRIGHFPIHQGITEEDLNELIESIRSIK